MNLAVLDSIAHGAAPANAPDTAASPLGHPFIFQVVNSTLMNAKQVKTAKWQEMKMWTLPVSIQRMDMWSLQQWLGNAHEAFTLGAPENVDLMAELPWPTLRKQLIRWEVNADLDAQGCATLEQLAIQDIDWSRFNHLAVFSAL